VAEGTPTTSWTATQDLANGAYSWRARAVDPNQPGPWMSSAHFDVAVDQPPAPPTGLVALPGDSQVSLAWNASPEPDVTGYRVYRAMTSGGPYEFVAATTAPAFTDTGLANGVTVYYVVTAIALTLESAASAEVAATPFGGFLAAEVRYAPRTIAGECLPACACGNGCPTWFYANVELPPGHDPAAIEVATVRLGGSVSPDRSFHTIVDDDQDGIPEMRLRFEFARVRPLLALGSTTLALTGRTAGVEFRGSDRIEVAPLQVSLRVTPRTLNRRSQGEDVQARLSFHGCAMGADVDVASLRLNGVVPVKRVVTIQGNELKVKFDRAAVAAILPVGNHVEVRVTGTVAGLAFAAVDQIRGKQ
jgi:hypothetical protein